MGDNLPELPKAGVNIAAGNWTAITDCRYYTADQLRSYALEAVRQERERCAELCDELDTLRSPRHTGYMGTASAGDAAAAIRARSEVAPEPTER